MQMEWFPVLKIGWLNGWLPLVFMALLDGFTFLVFPKNVTARLYGRVALERRHKILAVLGNLIFTASLILVVCTPLKIGEPVFVAGSILSLAAWAGQIKSFWDFRNTPPDRPVTRGMYKISRHPQNVMSRLAALGICIAVGSWAAVILWTIGNALCHWEKLAEEKACLKQYGEPYRHYLQATPRYFLFF
jgi:protein-S-isoprenylcysteine O-methyltransferase Ste14